DNVLGDRGRGKKRVFGVVSPLPFAGGNVKCTNLAIRGRHNREIARERGTGHNSARDVFVPLEFALLQAVSGNEALGSLDGVMVVADGAARDDHGGAQDRRSTPRIKLERDAPAQVAGLGVEAEKGSVADALLVEECGANQYAVADNIDRGIDVPLVLALLPEQFGLGRGKLILRRGECKGVGLLRDLILCLQFLKGSRIELLEFG